LAKWDAPSYRRRDVPRLSFAPVSLTLAALLAAGRADADVAPAQLEPGTSWATAQAVQRTRAGRDHAAHGDQDAALRSFMDAIGFDATYGPAYLALGEMYEARGDFVEAERAFSMGIDHVVGFFEALCGRARLRARLHRSSDAIADLEAALSLKPEEQGVLRELAGAYIAARAFPAALAVARRRRLAAEAVGDKRGAGEARAEVAALEGLVGEADPVAAGRSARGAVRRALWAAERKR
jgi:tetratricopeptide (TPR) repeat protein